MAKKRLLNCEFTNASSFKVNISNKGKLLYFFMFTNADDKGFVDTTNEIIDSLTKNDETFRNEINMALLNNDYKSALQELIDKGLIYEFVDNHNNYIYLIRHWYYHNKLTKGLWTNYGNFLNKVYVSNNEYILGKKPLKEDKLNEDNINNDIDTDMVSEEPKPKKPKKTLEDLSQEEIDKMSKEEVRDLLPI